MVRCEPQVGPRCQTSMASDVSQLWSSWSWRTHHPPRRVDFIAICAPSDEVREGDSGRSHRRSIFFDVQGGSMAENALPRWSLHRRRANRRPPNDGFFFLIVTPRT